MVDDILSDSSKREPTFYNLLGCDRNSSTDQITTEYRVRVRDLHPDKCSDKVKNEEFVNLQTAYSVISDGDARRVYDNWLDCPLKMTFEEYQRNQDTIKMSMHWVIPKETPSIAPVPSTTSSKMSPSPGEWADGSRRYQSDAVRRFRNYEI